MASSTSARWTCSQTFANHRWGLVSPCGRSWHRIYRHSGYIPLQDRGKPYVIVFCGVNGVGKSTNLAKIAYWLGQHGIKVTIAACDTFRAGEHPLAPVASPYYAPPCPIGLA